jgi:hypothetical protein
MTDPVQEQVLGYLLGALDDAEMEQVRARLEREPAYQQAWATLRRRLRELDAAETKFAHPAGLAERTCRFIFARSKPSPHPATRRRALSPLAAPAARASRFSWLDLTVSLAVFLLAGLLTLPAIETSRFRARLATCRDNLRELGTMLAAYSQSNQGYFPRVPTQGNLAAAGVYAPTLAQRGFLTEMRRVVCPDSPLADQGNFRLPTLAELQAADAQQAAALRQQMGGSYGYCIGYMDDGVFCPTKNLGRANFAIMADAPREELPDRQSADHGGRGQNVLFEDGHVQFLTSSQPSGWSDDIFANDRNQVAAGVHRDDSVIVSSGVAPIVYVKGESDR